MESVRSGSLKEISKFSFSGTSMMEPIMLPLTVSVQIEVLVLGGVHAARSERCIDAVFGKVVGHG